LGEVQSRISTFVAGRGRKEQAVRLAGTHSRQGLSVLLYHHIGIPKPETKHLALTVTPEKFRRQVRWLRWRGYTAITPTQWLEWCATRQPLPKKLVMFTFDDAYADNCTHAFPVLERYGFPSAVFVISGRVGGVASWDGLPLMTAQQIQHWSEHGVEIGAHTRTHASLTDVSDDVVADEVEGCKDDLMKAGLTARSFAYPYGHVDERVRAAVSKFFRLAFTCEDGLNDLGTDPCLMRRTMVQPGDTLLDIEIRAAFGENPLDRLRSRIRLRTRLASALRRFRLLSQ
jgi:peptidoglycan/xylan/chitin deacetylase (PgdA/CDA1 family)